MSVSITSEVAGNETPVGSDGPDVGHSVPVHYEGDTLSIVVGANDANS